MKRFTSIWYESATPGEQRRYFSVVWSILKQNDLFSDAYFARNSILEAEVKVEELEMSKKDNGKSSAEWHGVFWL